jgi:Fic family protein
MKQFKSGQYINQSYYKSFQPSQINRQWEFSDMELLSLLSQADQEIGRLDMFSHYIPNVDLFIRMHVAKEATSSTRIEGTRTNIDQVVQDSKSIPAEKRADWDEVQNYIKALNDSIEALKKIPLSTRLIRHAHKTLLQGVRGDAKSPGSFRRSQNWIGGATLKDATFIPPVHTEVPSLMSDLEKFFHNEKVAIPELLKTALIHYQFETIHPFLDGNGRTGRLLIPLYLVNKGVLKNPVLYISEFFEKNRSLYFDNLMSARINGNLIQWLKFFLVGIIQTAQSGINTFDKILQLKNNTDQKLALLGSRASKAVMLVDELYKQPVIDAEKVAESIGISMPSAYKLIEAMVEKQILKEITGGQRNRVFVFEEYLSLFR